METAIVALLRQSASILCDSGLVAKRRISTKHPATMGDQGDYGRGVLYTWLWMIHEST